MNVLIEPLEPINEEKKTLRLDVVSTSIMQGGEFYMAEKAILLIPKFAMYFDVELQINYRFKMNLRSRF